VKKKIDIEKLLHWAVRDELPKGRAVTATPWDVITQFGALGTVVQTSGYGDGFGFVSGDPHDDALIVAEAVRSLDRDARFEDIGDVLSLFGDLIGIAGDAPGLLLLATFDPQALVLSNATRGVRPKWDFEQPTPRQVFAPSITGRPRAMVYGMDGDGDLVEVRANKKTGRFNMAMTPRSPLLWHEPSMVHVGECRAEWVTWHGALTRLALALAGKLETFDVVAPALPLLPWVTGSDRPRVIAGRDLASEAFDPRLAPKRHAPGKPTESPIEAETIASYARASRGKMRKSVAA
jgi:hypothetical protein